MTRSPDVSGHTTPVTAVAGSTTTSTNQAAAKSPSRTRTTSASAVGQSDDEVNTICHSYTLITTCVSTIRVAYTSLVNENPVGKEFRKGLPTIFCHMEGLAGKITIAVYMNPILRVITV